MLNGCVRWVVVRRPYVFLYREERDPCERALINLATSRTEFKHHPDTLNVANTFRYTITGSPANDFIG